MKKNILWLLGLLLPLMGTLSSCSDDDDIVFDHERQMFEIQEGKILLEVILPNGTTAGEEIYISGAFNGGDEAAVGKEEYKLIRTEQSNIKRAVYLDPATFVEGKTLADGFHFVSDKQRQEVDLKGNDKWHYDNPRVSTFTNVTVERWAAFFDQGGEEGGEGVDDTDPDVAHDGYVLYILNESSETDLALYAWGDAEAYGKWPGMTPPTGTCKIAGKVYTYFDLGAANEGLNLHLIPNNNGGGVQWEGDDLFFTIDHNIYVRIFDDGYEVLDEPQTAGPRTDPDVAHDGPVLYIFNESSETDLALYAWGDAEAYGKWPGMTPPTGTRVIKDVEYTYFDLGAANIGLSLHLIPNNNAGGVQWEGDDLSFTLEDGQEIYLHIWDGGSYELMEKP